MSMVLSKIVVQVRQLDQLLITLSDKVNQSLTTVVLR